MVVHLVFCECYIQYVFLQYTKSLLKVKRNFQNGTYTPVSINHICTNVYFEYYTCQCWTRLVEIPSNLRYSNQLEHGNVSGHLFNFGWNCNVIRNFFSLFFSWKKKINYLQAIKISFCIDSAIIFHQTNI